MEKSSNLDGIRGTKIILGNMEDQKKMLLENRGISLNCIK